MKIAMTPLTVLLAGVNFLLLTGIIWFLLFVDGTSVPELPISSITLAEEAAEPGPGRAQVQLNYDALLQKALFHEVREMIKVDVPAPQQPKPQVVRSVLTDYQLTGIVYRAQGDSLAYITGKRNGEYYKLKAGESFEGWQVVVVRKTEIIVSRDGRQELMVLVRKE